MLAEPGAALTDLALGVVALAMAASLARPAEVAEWRTALRWTGVAALAGASHHAVVTRSAAWSEVSWTLIGGLIVVSVAALLAATVRDVLGPGPHLGFTSLRTASIGAYVVLAASGRHGVATMLACQTVMMLAIVALWLGALRRGHPRAPAVLTALAVSAAAGCTRALPAGTTALLGLDPVSLYHLAQIPGVVLLAMASGRTCSPRVTAGAW